MYLQYSHYNQSSLLIIYTLWKKVFDENEVHIAFNTFLNIFIRYFCNSFPKSFTRPHTNTKAWITSSVYDQNCRRSN
jgi:hypothetical protein